MYGKGGFYAYGVSRNVLLREMGLGPSRISRMGRRPDG
jgi:hypothetical protein